MSEQKNIIPLGRQDFDRDLGKLEAELILMSGLVEQAIFNALNALKYRDVEKSQKVPNGVLLKDIESKINMALPSSQTALLFAIPISTTSVIVVFVSRP